MTRTAHGYGLATIAADGTVLDTWYPAPALGEPEAGHAAPEWLKGHVDAVRGVSVEVVFTEVDLDAPPAAASDAYTIDTVHSYPHFSVGHLGMSTIYGRFDAMAGKITLDRAAKAGTIDVKINTASVSTGNAKMEPGSWAAKTYGPRSRDEHLRSADFFNVAEFPEMTYKSTKFNFNGDNVESIDGQLTRKDGPAEPLTRETLIGAEERALRLLAASTVAFAVALVIMRVA